MAVRCDVPGVLPSRALAIARAARAAFRGRAPPVVRIVPGSAPPHEEGSGWHFETKGGRRIWHPSAYSKIGWSNMVYVASTRELVVGASWKRGTLPEPSPSEVWRSLLGPDARMRAFSRYSHDPVSLAPAILPVAHHARFDRPLFRALHGGGAKVLDELQDDCDPTGGVSSPATWRLLLAVVVEASRRGGLLLERRCAEVELLCGAAVDRAFDDPAVLVHLARELAGVEHELREVGIDTPLPLPPALWTRTALVRLGL